MPKPRGAFIVLDSRAGALGHAVADAERVARCEIRDVAAELGQVLGFELLQQEAEKLMTGWWRIARSHPERALKAATLFARREGRGVLRSKLVLGIGDGWLKVDGTTIYQAKDLKVGLFQGAAEPVVG